MAHRKAHEVDGFFRRLDNQYRTVLVYGPNTGLVNERARQFAKSTGIDLDDPFAMIRIDADTAASNANRVSEDAHTIGMFGGSRLIWISGNTQKHLVKSIIPVLATPPEDAWILIEAGDLKKSAPLRKAIENASSAMALPCYADDIRSINALIDDELAQAGLSIEPDAQKFLASLLGADRQASRNEVEKLCLYAKGSSSINVDDVAAIVGDASAFAIDEAVDAACTGNLVVVQNTLARLFDQGTHASVVASAAQRHFQALHKARSEMEFSRQTAQSVMSRMRPPPMFNRKNAITTTLNIWSLPALEKALERLDQTSFDSRANAGLSNALVSMALLAISIDAARQKSRR